MTIFSFLQRNIVIIQMKQRRKNFSEMIMIFILEQSFFFSFHRDELYEEEEEEEEIFIKCVIKCKSFFSLLLILSLFVCLFIIYSLFVRLHSYTNRLVYYCDKHYREKKNVRHYIFFFLLKESIQQKNKCAYAFD